MTSAERAKDLVDAIFLSGSQWGEHDWKYAQEIIAEALRRAQNDKLEEAARVAENPGFIQARDTEWDMGVNYAKPFIANAIRSLIQKD